MEADPQLSKCCKLVIFIVLFYVLGGFQQMFVQAVHQVFDVDFSFFFYFNTFRKLWITSAEAQVFALISLFWSK